MRLLPIEVRAEPESCRRTAAQLALLAEVCRHAARRLERLSRVGDDDLGGLSGDAYRQRVANTATTCAGLAARCDRLAEGLADYARGIDEVRRLMGILREEAAPWLTTCDWAVWSPTRPRDPADEVLTRCWEAWDDAVGSWRAARALEDLTQRRWRQVLQPQPALGDPDPPAHGDVLPPVHTHDDLGPPPMPYDDGPSHPGPGAGHGPGHQPQAEPVPGHPAVVLPVSWAGGTGLGAVLEAGGGDVIGPGDRDLWLPTVAGGADDGPVGAAR